MRRASVLGLSILITVAVPLVLAGNATMALFQPWSIDALYALPGVPGDAGEDVALAGTDRSGLARTGVRSVAPLGDGAEILGDERLADGSPAFNEREISHMRDVHGALRWIGAAWLALLAGLAVAVVSLRRSGQGPLAAAAARRGLVATFTVVGLAAAVMLLDFGFAFDTLHSVLFSEGTWTFPSDSVLLWLYPESFWTAGGAALGLLVLLQAAALALLLRRNAPAGGRPGSASGPRMR